MMNDVYNRVQEKLSNPTDLREQALADYLKRKLPEEIYEGALVDRRGLLGQMFNQAPLVSPAAEEVERVEGEQ